jgi:uncharacterized membrane protein
MRVETLMIIAIGLLLFLIVGLLYLIVLRIKKAKNRDDDRLESLSEALMEKLESQPLSEAQKARIAEALKELRERS